MTSASLGAHHKPHLLRYAPRLEIKLIRLRMSILQQSAATAAAAAAAAAAEEEDGSSGDEERDDGDDERRRGGNSTRGKGSSSPAAVTEKWTAMFEARDRAGTGTATTEELQEVLEEVNVENLNQREIFAAGALSAGTHRCIITAGTWRWAGCTAWDRERPLAYHRGRLIRRGNIRGSDRRGCPSNTPTKIFRALHTSRSTVLAAWPTALA